MRRTPLAGHHVTFNAVHVNKQRLVKAASQDLHFILAMHSASILMRGLMLQSNAFNIDANKQI